MMWKKISKILFPVKIFYSILFFIFIFIYLSNTYIIWAMWGKVPGVLYNHAFDRTECTAVLSSMKRLSLRYSLQLHIVAAHALPIMTEAKLFPINHLSGSLDTTNSLRKAMLK
jgi:hypothetical protein